MLDMGFEPQIRRVVRAMPPTTARHTLLFSATFPDAIQRLAREFLRPYVWIGVGRVGSTVDGIEQRIVRAAPDKRKKLQLVVAALGERRGRTLVFVEKKRTATWLKKMLRAGGPADAPPEERFPPEAAEDIHGDRSQSQREAALARPSGHGHVQDASVTCPRHVPQVVELSKAIYLVLDEAGPDAHGRFSDH